MKVADYVAQFLAEYGVTHIFGIIGGGNVTLWDAITRLGKTELICTHHEQAATMAASYYARVGNRLGVALVTSGAGSANAITGVIAANMDSVPLLILSGNENANTLRGFTRVKGMQGYDSTQVVTPVTKDAWRMWTPKFASGIETSVEYAMKPRKGPVWCDVPRDVQNAEL